MEFKNRPNIPHEIEGRTVWESRSVAVVGVVILYDSNGNGYVLASRRGPNSADYKGKMNLVAGYLDYDENGTEAVVRESWEETGFDILEHKKKLLVIKNNLYDPWSVNTEITTNLQNITLRYGIILYLPENEEFPSLTTEHNEIVGECEDPVWMPLDQFQKHEWAFNHDQVILEYSLLTYPDTWIYGKSI